MSMESALLPPINIKDKYIYIYIFKCIHPVDFTLTAFSREETVNATDNLNLWNRNEAV